MTLKKFAEFIQKLDKINLSEISIFEATANMKLKCRVFFRTVEKGLSILTVKRSLITVHKVLKHKEIVPPPLSIEKIEYI